MNCELNTQFNELNTQFNSIIIQTSKYRLEVKSLQTEQKRSKCTAENPYGGETRAAPAAPRGSQAHYLAPGPTALPAPHGTRAATTPPRRPRRPSSRHAATSAAAGGGGCPPEVSHPVRRHGPRRRLGRLGRRRRGPAAAADRAARWCGRRRRRWRRWRWRWNRCRSWGWGGDAASAADRPPSFASGRARCEDAAAAATRVERR